MAKQAADYEVKWQQPTVLGTPGFERHTRGLEGVVMETDNGFITFYRDHLPVLTIPQQGLLSVEIINNHGGK